MSRLSTTRCDNLAVMDGLKKFTLWFLLPLLFIGCRAGVPLKTPQAELQEIENAFLAGKWDEVITLGEKRLEGKPDNAVVHFVLSMSYYMTGKYEIQEQHRSLALEDEKNVDAIIAWCKDLVQKFPNNYYAYLLLGSAYRGKDEVDKAMESYQKAVEINPNFSDAYLGLGAIYFAEEKVDDAIKYIKKAVEINPKHLAAYYSLGLIYEYTDQTDEAIASYEKVIEINPGFKEAYINLGDLYLEKGDRDKAIKAYEKVIELDPENELAIYAKGAIEKAQGHSDTEAEKKP